MTNAVADEVDVVQAPAPGEVIPTVAAMAALPVGTTLDSTYDGNVEKWERTDNGWACIHRGGVVIPDSMRVPIAERWFEGLLSGGHIRVSRPPVPAFEIGQVLMRGSHTYVVHSITEGSANVGCFSGTSFVGPDTLPPGFLVRDGVHAVPMEDQPTGTWLPLVLATMHGDRARLIAQRDAAIQERSAALTERNTERMQRGVLQNEVDNLREQASSLPAETIRALHTYGEDADDSDFDNLLDRLGIARRQQLPVTVTITGRNYATASVEMMAGLVGGLVPGQITDVESSCVTWRKVFDVERSGLPGQCMCDDVGDEDSDVQAQVPDDADEWEIESCTCRHG